MITEEQSSLDSTQNTPNSQYNNTLQEQWISLGVMVVPSEQEQRKCY